MKISYKKLQTIFDDRLPAVEQLAEGIIFHAFEVEEIEPVADDYILDFKVLPDRAPGLKTELDLAKEIGAIFRLPFEGNIIEGDDSRRVLEVGIDFINQKLGISVPKLEVLDILTWLDLKPTEVNGLISCLIPSYRSDLELPENLVEEVGRLFGYDKVPATALPELVRGQNDQNFTKSQAVRSALLPIGFSEIFGYSFSKQGDFEILKPLQKDKPFLRTNLTDGLKDKLEFNLKNVLFDNQGVLLFEIGSVFPVSGEEIRVALAGGYNKPKFNQSEKLINEALLKLGVNKEKVKSVKTDTLMVAEFLLADTPVSEINLIDFIKPNVEYKKFSVFPSIVRDIALFVPGGTIPDDVSLLIASQAKDLLVRGPILFDEFHKDGKISLAFRLVFQAYDRTLLDEEVGEIMSKIIKTLEANPNFEVRK